jgi:hypothetical protein
LPPPYLITAVLDRRATPFARFPSTHPQEGRFAVVTNVGQECDGRDSAVRVSGSRGGIPSADVRFNAHSGLKSDIA